MQNISVYLNKRASNGENDWKAQISSALFRSNVEYQSPSDLTELYQNLDKDVANNVDAVLSVGGDGTVNTIIQRLAGTNISLLVVPGGTANDFARTLGTNTSIKKISQTIRQNKKEKIDLININGKFMATNGGLGFASDVANEINEMRIKLPLFKNFMKFSGKKIYSLFLAKKLLSKEMISYKFRVQSEEFSETVISSLIMINNQPCLGGDFTVAPNTNNQDGKVNITIFKHQNRLELIQCIYKILDDQFPIDDKSLIVFETCSVKIDLIDSPNISFFGDGEMIDNNNSWIIQCVPQALSVFTAKEEVENLHLCTQVSLI